MLVLLRINCRHALMQDYCGEMDGYRERCGWKVSGKLEGISVGGVEWVGLMGSLRNQGFSASSLSDHAWAVDIECPIPVDKSDPIHPDRYASHWRGACLGVGTVDLYVHVHHGHANRVSTVELYVHVHRGHRTQGSTVELYCHVHRG